MSRRSKECCRGPGGKSIRLKRPEPSHNELRDNIRQASLYIPLLWNEPLARDGRCYWSPIVLAAPQDER